MKRKHVYLLSLEVLLAAILAKFMYSYFAYSVALGYDVGMYRYLFLQYAHAIKEFSMPDLLPWAKEHPPGLFLIIGSLIAIGVPVDFFLGWIWNLIPVALLSFVAFCVSKRHGVQMGLLTLLSGLLSIAYYDGFFAMYMKVYISLIFLVLTFLLIEKLSFLSVITALLTIIIHQQTGLILILSLTVWWLLHVKTYWQNTSFRVVSIGCVVVAVIATLWYLPQWERAIWSPLKSIVLLRGEIAPAGAFPELAFYIQTGGILLGLGAFGLLRSLRNEKGSLWQIAVVVCSLFIVFQLVFHRRFFLYLDFFLLPFVASAIAYIWKQARHRVCKLILILLLLVQAILSVQVLRTRTPVISESSFTQILRLDSALPKDATVISLENISGMWLLGWLPSRTVGAPGLFDTPGWSYEQWEAFVDGTNEDRRNLLQELQGPVYFYGTTFFEDYYGERAQKILNDPCMKPLSIAPVLLSVCSQ